MKLYVEEKRKYYKYKDIPFEQPLLTSNTGNKDFKVWGWDTGGDIWNAFATRTWSGYYITAYANEGNTSLGVCMFSSNPLLITGYTYYSPTVNSDSDWGSIRAGEFYGSNDPKNWELLHTHGAAWQDSYQTFEFENQNYYKFFRYIMYNYPAGHRDRVNLSCFCLHGKERTVISGSSSNYDFYRDVLNSKGVYKNNLYYGLKSEGER